MELIFLTYINRSGSTYLAQILSSSREILVCPEAEVLVEKFLEDPGKKFKSTESEGRKQIQGLNSDWKFKYWYIAPEELESLSPAPNNYGIFYSIINLYKEKIKPGALKILFKAERILYLWDKIKGASQSDDLLHLIAVVRDPRGVYASQKQTVWPGSEKPFSQNPVQTGILWNRFIRELHRLMKTHSDVTVVRYEDLIKAPAGSLEYLTRRINLRKTSFSPGDGDYYSRIPENQRQIHGNIKLQPLREKEDEWKRILNELEIELIQNITSKCMKISGYSKEARKICFLKLQMKIIPKTISFYFSYCSKKLLFWINKILKSVL